VFTTDYRGVIYDTLRIAGNNQFLLPELHMKKVTNTKSYIIEVHHNGDDFICHSAVKHLNDDARTVVNVDINEDASLRMVLDLDGRKICPDKFSGKPVDVILNDEFWAGSGILDLTKGAEVFELAVEFTETGVEQYKPVHLEPK